MTSTWSEKIFSYLTMLSFQWWQIRIYVLFDVLLLYMDFTFECVFLKKVSILLCDYLLWVWPAFWFKIAQAGVLNGITFIFHPLHIMVFRLEADQFLLDFVASLLSLLSWLS